LPVCHIFERPKPNGGKLPALDMVLQDALTDAKGGDNRVPAPGGVDDLCDLRLFHAI
tara:strand:+ start:1222 stop:1392 length:171 start_codon:yes stop_codon:yes gene_type:complete